MNRRLFPIFLALIFVFGLVPAWPTSAASLPFRTVSGSLAAPLAAYSATATVSNATPHHNARVTVTGTLKNGKKPVAGATMRMTWFYKSTTSSCTGVTNSNGVASCTRDISRATYGYKVVLSVKFTNAKGTVLATTSTSFTPR